MSQTTTEITPELTIARATHRDNLLAQIREIESAHNAHIVDLQTQINDANGATADKLAPLREQLANIATYVPPRTPLDELRDGMTQKWESLPDDVQALFAPYRKPFMEHIETGRYKVARRMLELQDLSAFPPEVEAARQEFLSAIPSPPAEPAE